MSSEKVTAFAQIYNPYSQKIQFFEGVTIGQIPDMEWTSFDKKVVLGFVKSDKTLSDFPLYLDKSTLDTTSKESYLNFVASIKNAIHQGQFQKAVAARIINIAQNTMHWHGFFDKLVLAFPSTFVFCIFHPLSGLWIGASPELVGYLHDNMFKTISLAGTVWDADNFQSKEQHEQEIVTDCLIDLLQKKGLQATVKQIQTLSYGQIKHLVNQIEVRGFLASDFENMVCQMHPSPALSGFPMNEATHFILNNEPIQRGFYSGLITWKISATQKLAFATIRCFQVFENQLSFYVGGGITQDSIPQTEYEETQRKFEVVYSAIS